MGTSASSKGPNSGSGIPIVPPWVDDPSLADPVLSTERRWQGVRTSFGKFARSNDYERMKYLRRGLGKYSRQGLSGSHNAVRRMSSTISSVEVLHRTLSSLSVGAGIPQDFGIDPNELIGKSSLEFSDVIVDIVRPLDGTQDAEVTRDSISRSLSEVIDQGADITKLTSDEIDQVIALTIASDVASRIDLDVGLSILKNAETKEKGFERLQEMKDYVSEVVKVQYNISRSKFHRVRRAEINRITTEAIQQTFEIFEESE